MPPTKPKVANADRTACVVATCGAPAAKSWWWRQNADGSRSWCCGGEDGRAHRAARAGEGWRQWRPAEDVLPLVPPQPGSMEWWAAATGEQVRARLASWAEPPWPLLEALMEAADGVAWDEQEMLPAIDAVLAPRAATIAAVKLELSVHTTQQTTTLSLRVREDAAQRHLLQATGGRVAFTVYVGRADTFERPDFKPHAGTTFMWYFGGAGGRGDLNGQDYTDAGYTDAEVDGAEPRGTSFAWGNAPVELDLGFALREGDAIEVRMQTTECSEDGEEYCALKRFSRYVSSSVAASLLEGGLKYGNNLGSGWCTQSARARAPPRPPAASAKRVPGRKSKAPLGLTPVRESE